MRMINSRGNDCLGSVCLSPDTKSFTPMPVFPSVRKPKLREVKQLAQTHKAHQQQGCHGKFKPLYYTTLLILPLTSKSPSSRPLKIRRLESISFMESKYQTHRHHLIHPLSQQVEAKTLRMEGFDLGATPLSQYLRP